jgi:[calcium/calmodulin-dependent protein kinase] kinase
MYHPFITNNGEFSFLDQDCEEISISEKEISAAISKLTLRATVTITAKLK